MKIEVHWRQGDTPFSTRGHALASRLEHLEASLKDDISGYLDSIANTLDSSTSEANAALLVAMFQETATPQPVSLRLTIERVVELQAKLRKVQTLRESCDPSATYIIDLETWSKLGLA